MVKIKSGCFWILLALLATLKHQQRSPNTCRIEAIPSTTIDLSNGLDGNYKDGGKSIASIAADRAIPNVSPPTSRLPQIVATCQKLQS